MQRFKIIKGLSLITGMLLIAIIISCSGEIGIADQPVDFSLQAANLYQAFSENEVAGNEKYVGKILEVIGKAKGLSTSEDGVMTLILETNEVGAVYCNFSKKERPSPSKIKTGEIVKVKGLCSGFLMDVMLDNSVLLNE